MRFVSDATGVGNGFRAVYQTVGVGKEILFHSNFENYTIFIRS